VILAALLAPLVSQAAGLNTWTGGGNDTNWATGGNWDQTHAPAAGEIAVINGAQVNLYTDTADLGGLIVTNGAILSVYSPATNGATQWGLLVSVSGTVSIAGNAWIHPYSQNTNGGSAWFRCLDLVVGTNSGFNANSKGFSGGIHLVNSSRGFGPGGGEGNTYPGNNSGGGYGGQGGRTEGRSGGSKYGVATLPVEPGSGGAGGTWGAYANGGAGGGLIHVEAVETVTVDGSLLANGQNSPQGYAGAGSGGGIYIACKSFQGSSSGSLQAKGGAAIGGQTAPSGAGGGGRIAVIYDSGEQALLSSQPLVTFNAAGGNMAVNYFASEPLARWAQGRPGSIYFTDSQFFDLARIQGGEIMVPGVSAWSMNSLTASDGLIAFPAGFTLTVTQNVTVSAGGGLEMSNSVLTIGGDLAINSDRRGTVYFNGGADQAIHVGGSVSVTQGRLDVGFQASTNLTLKVPGNIAVNAGHFLFHANPTNAGTLAVAGNISITNSSVVYLYSAMTNGTTAYGLLVDVTGDVSIASGGWLYPYSHYTNGGSVYFQAENLTVLSGGGINASAKGFAGGIYGVNSSYGWGPGAPKDASASGNNPGGGYGGQGGRTAWARGGASYGDSTHPFVAGSGGAGGSAGAYANGGYGGGLIHVEVAETVMVDGSILANGQDSPHGYAGTGSGGGIYIACKRFKGSTNGTVQAKGGVATGGQTAASGGGGGGRIAVVYDSGEQALLATQPKVTFNAAGGNMAANYFAIEPYARWAQGRPGSLYFTDSQFFDLARIHGGEIMVPGVSSWSTTTLNAGDGLIAFPTGFNLTLSQNLNVTGGGGIELSNSVLNIAGDFIINSDRRGTVYLNGGPNQQINLGGSISITQGRLDVDLQAATNLSLQVPGSISINAGNLLVHANPTNACSLSVSNNLSLTNGALAYLYSAATNGITVCGLQVAVAGTIGVSPRSWIYTYSHYTNGGSVHFQAANVTVATNAGFDATGKGFGGGVKDVNGSRGYGPGTPQGAPESMQNAAAGYGGEGGRSAARSGGPTYGNSNAPIHPGSGGPSTITYGNAGAGGGYGGGLIYIEAADTVLVDGSLLANGVAPAVWSYSGSGSGGGIYINCKEIRGASTGLLRANGGVNTGGQNGGGGGGGGGRIAVWYKVATNNWLGTALANGGTGVYTNGAHGTVVFYQKPPTGTLIMVN
jgi:hypothetical protein